MDIIYTDANKKEVGVITKYALDLEEATDKEKCSFEIQMSINDFVLELGSLIYAENTEYGGQVDTLKIDTAQNTVYAGGRTWRGILGSKILQPPSGTAYKTVTGHIGTVIATIISEISLTSIFEVNCRTDYTVNYKFERYVDAYTGLLKMVYSYGHKLTFSFNPLTRKVTIGSDPIKDYSRESEITSDMFEFKLEKGLPTVNHLIGLGSGELEDRTVIHKYLQKNGTVADTQAYFGLAEIAAIYDYPNAESEDDLKESTEAELLEMCVADKMTVTARNINADIGDKFTATDITTGINMTQYVINKIVTIDNDDIKYSYTVGEQIK